MKHKITKTMMTLLLCGVFFLASCAPGAAESMSLEAMDTFMSLKIYSDRDALSRLGDEMKRLDSLLSATEPGSAVYRLNEKGTVENEAELSGLVSDTLKLCEATGGALDITVAPVVKAWGFIDREYRIPSRAELEMLLSNVGYEKVKPGEGGSVSLDGGAQIDLGAVAKGYAADRCEAILDEAETKSALLNLGGTVYARGKKPDGSLWKIGIADPGGQGGYMGYIECSDKIVATSGSYERFFVGEDGKTYCHIIDPSDGYPADNGTVSVTVVSDSGLRSDALSTALFVMGADRAEEYHKAHPDFEYIILTESREAIVSGGIADSFTLGGDSSYRIIRR